MVHKVCNIKLSNKIFPPLPLTPPHIQYIKCRGPKKVSKTYQYLRRQQGFAPLECITLWSAFFAMIGGFSPGIFYEISVSYLIYNFICLATILNIFYSTVHCAGRHPSQPAAAHYAGCRDQQVQYCAYSTLLNPPPPSPCPKIFFFPSSSTLFSLHRLLSIPSQPLPYRFFIFLCSFFPPCLSFFLQI